MSVLSFKIESQQYKDLYNDALGIIWHSHENFVDITFKDSNKNYITLINIISDKTKNDILVNVLENGIIVRYYTIQLLPIKHSQSPLYLDVATPPILNATFKILKSEVNFLESTNE